MSKHEIQFLEKDIEDLKREVLFARARCVEVERRLYRIKEKISAMKKK